MKIYRDAYAWIAVGIASTVALALIFYANRLFYEEFLATSASYATSALPKRQDNDKMRIEVDFGENNRRVFEGVSYDSFSLDQALKSIAASGRITFTAGSDKILYIAGTRGNWKIYKNGVLVKGLLSSLVIRPGDRYTLRLEK